MDISEFTCRLSVFVGCSHCLKKPKNIQTQNKQQNIYPESLIWRAAPIKIVHSEICGLFGVTGTLVCGK